MSQDQAEPLLERKVWSLKKPYDRLLLTPQKRFPSLGLQYFETLEFLTTVSMPLPDMSN